jgi:hypothetical protein
MRLAVRAFVALTDGRYGVTAERVEELVQLGDAEKSARNWLLQSLERFDLERPGVPWTYGLTTRLLIADGQMEAARAGLNIFRQKCETADCRDYASRLEAALGGSRNGV